MSIFFVSIRFEFAEMILSGAKRWEFRRNPRFGSDLMVGDRLFVVSTSSQGGAVTGLCRIERILRGTQVDDWFGDKSTGRWLEAGCAEQTSRDWEFFSQNILSQFPVALRLDPTRLEPPLALRDIVHCTSGKPWRGIGLTALEGLGRYKIDGRPADQVFLGIAQRLGRS